MKRTCQSLAASLAFTLVLFGCADRSIDSGSIADATAAPKRIIVSGASGRLGGEVAEFLLERGVPATNLILVSRTPDKLSQFTKRGANVRFGDFDRPESLDSAFSGGSTLFLISTNTMPPRRLRQHLAAIEAAKRTGVRQIVYTSITAADRMAKAGVLPDHHETEGALKRSGLLWTILRNQTYAESELRGASMSVASGEYHTNAGRGRIAYVAHRDCAEAAAVVLSTSGHDGKIYEITGPELVSPEDVARTLGDVSGKPIKVVNLTDAEYLDELAGYGIPKEYANLLTSLNKAVREGVLSVRSADFERLTARKPKSLREVIEENRAKLLEPAGTSGGQLVPTSKSQQRVAQRGR
jgi:NAD(P)H dehydrogenase (quinone)